MTTQTTLLAAVMPLFTDQIERAATEALRHILQQSAPARDALSGMLLSAGVTTDPLTRFQTEVGGDDGERVDLVCADDTGEERVLIEAKFWAGLTDNQPNIYLARLPQTGDSALLFVAPAQRLETLWPELCRRAQRLHQLTLIDESGDLRRAAVNESPRQMLLTSWRALLEQMATRAGNAGDTAIATDIRQLLGLTQRMDANAFLPIHPAELGQEFPRRMRNLRNLVDDAAHRAFAQGWANAQGLATTPQAYGYGRYIRLNGVVVWFGVNFDSWASNGQSPLWLHSTQSAGRYPVTLPTGVEYADVLDAVVQQLYDIGQELNPKTGGE